MITAKCDICGAPAPIEVVRIYENFLDMGEDYPQPPKSNHQV